MSAGTDKKYIDSNIAGNGLQKTLQTDAMSVKSDTVGGANLARAINVSANGVAVKIDNDTVKENGSNRLFVYKLWPALDQIDSFASGTANFKDINTTLTAVATDDTARTSFTAGTGVFVDASGAYGVGGGSLPSPVQVTGLGRPGTVLIRVSGSNASVDDGLGNEVYGVLFFDTDDSKFYIRYFSDPSGVQTAYTFSATTIDLLFNEIYTFATLPQDAIARSNGGFIDLVAGDITAVTAGAGLTGGGSSGSVTLDVGAGSGITVNANDVAINLAAASGLSTSGGLAILPDTVDTNASAAIVLAATGTAINGDVVDIDFTPVNYSPTVGDQSVDVDDLAAHLNGIDLAFATFSQSEAFKKVKVATTGDVTLVGGAPNTVDGIVLVASDRVLVWQQSSAAENGVYTVTTLGTGADGTWTRATDNDTADEIRGCFVGVRTGTLYGAHIFASTSPVPLLASPKVFADSTQLFQGAYGITVDYSAFIAKIEILKDTSDADKTEESDAIILDPANGVSIDGDIIDIDFTPSNYTPTITGAPEAIDAADLTAHLKGIDNAIGTLTPLTQTVDKPTYSGAYVTYGVVPLSAIPFQAFAKFIYFQPINPKGDRLEYAVDYELINITAAGATTLATGYYIAIATNTTALLIADGATVTGTDPSTGIFGIATSGDKFLLEYWV